MVDLSNKKMQELFLDCLKNDSFKILFHIDQHYKINYTPTVINALNQSIRDSQWYFEIKMYFVRRTFVILNVSQMDKLLDLFDSIFKEPNAKKHPLVNCYNPVKCALFVYEICWLINQKNIYSLQRKCDGLTSYLKDSLDKYFNK